MPSTTPPSRLQFALVGPSPLIDPLREAVRPDLADVRLAHRVFAPHYAAAISTRVARSAPLRAGADAGSAVLAELPQGAAFELLERVGGRAWGVAPEPGLVGYLDEDAL